MRRRIDLAKACAVAVALHGAALLLLGMNLLAAWTATPGEGDARACEVDVMREVARPAASDRAPVPVPAAIAAEERLPAIQQAMPEMPAVRIPEPTLSAPAAQGVSVRVAEGVELPGEVIVPLVTGAGEGRPSGATAGVDSGDRPPELAQLVRPLYPSASRRRNESGRVTLVASVDGKGRVQGVRVTRGSGFEDLDSAAVAAAQKAEFRAAQRGGEAVAAECELVFEFRLEDR